MIITKAHTITLKGTNYEVGYMLGKIVALDEVLLSKCNTNIPEITAKEIEEAKILFDHWCPGLTEELSGFQDALGLPSEYMYFYSMTYLIPQCSQIALSSNITVDKKPMLARNYEFIHDLEDNCLIKTCVQGKYTHIGTSMLQFGRDEGINEHGLAITMSSCGMPIANLPYTDKPKVKGLQYWVVIRALLENCKDIDEVISYLEGMPIAFNMNLIAIDKSDNMILIQTMNGKIASKQLHPTNNEFMLHATNHSVLPELMHLEPQVFKHSIVRYQFIKEYFNNRNTITDRDVKELLLANYPSGLCFHHFLDGFGTTKSILLSPIDGTIEVCWGGEIENKWRKYDIQKEINNEIYDIILEDKKAPKDFFKYETR